jgi:hypothetical protein
MRTRVCTASLQAEDGEAAAAGEQPAEDEDLLVDLSLKKKKKKKKVRRRSGCGGPCINSSVAAAQQCGSSVAFDARMHMRCTGLCNHLVWQLPNYLGPSWLCLAAIASRATFAQQSAVGCSHRLTWGDVCSQKSDRRSQSQPSSSATAGMWLCSMWVCRSMSAAVFAWFQSNQHTGCLVHTLPSSALHQSTRSAFAARRAH